MSRSWRLHRFVPLALRPAGVAATEAFQQSVDRGFREGHESGSERGYKEGLERGLEEGRNEGTAQAHEEARTRFEAIAAPVDAIRERLAALQADYEAALRKEVVELVERVAREVVRREITLQPALLLSLVDEALSTLPTRPQTAIEVYLSPEDLERIAQIDSTRATAWNLIPDPALQRGECRIKAGEREADAGCRGRLAACMEQIAHQLLTGDESVEAAA